MFTQRLSMDCTKWQYEKFLKEELLKMGYNDNYTTFWTEETVIVNNSNGQMGDLGTLIGVRKEKHNRTYLGSFNAPLFLALAAMTDNAEGNYGEYWVCIRDNTWFTKADLYKSIGVYHDKSPMFYDNEGAKNGAVNSHLFKYFRKATKEEVMAKFGKTENDTNYDAASDAKEQLDAISLLKSKGYKILKPKIWEEV